MRQLCTWILLLLTIVNLRALEKLKIIYSWKSLDFVFPSEHARLAAIKSGNFIPGSPLPIDVDVYNGESKSTVFIAIPRFQDGVPLTLGYVTDEVSLDGNTLIAPYPNWSYNDAGNCASIISVYRMQIDECDRLWVLDTGKLGSKQVCPPKLHVFSLRDNKLIMLYRFPEHQYKNEDSLFVTVAVDVRDRTNNCKDTFAYIADVTGFALIVYDFRNSRSWKINNNLFYPYPPYGTFNIKGDTFDLMDGILGLALGPIHNGDRILYFHSLASRVESWVSTSVIRNYTLFHEKPEAAARSFVPFEHERSSQSVAEAMNHDGVLFYGLLSDLAIGCWNSKHYPQFGGKNNEIIVSNPETLQFPSGLKIITSKKGKQELWVLSVSFQRYMSGTLHSNETNFRIQAGFVDELVRGTKCDVSTLGGRFHRQRDKLFFRTMLTPWLLVVFLGIICQGSTSWIRSYNPFARNLENAMHVVYEWKYIDFDFGSEERRQAAISSGEYNYTTVNPIDVDRWRNLTFVTVIRDEGVPSSLNVISDKRGPGGPLLTPYPNWNWTSTKTCSSIISVYRVSIDRCNRLWVLDTGVIGDNRVCPAKLVVFDLTTSELLQQVEIPENIAINSTSGQGLLITPAVQTFNPDCDRTYVYIADVDGYGLIVYDGSSFRRLTSNAFNFDPRYINYTIEGTSFQLRDGIVGMAISPLTNNLYFSPMSSHNLDHADTYQLMLVQGDQVQYRVAEDILWTQASAKAVSRSGAVFFGLVNDTSIGCWNEFRSLNRENIGLVARNRRTLQFTSGLKVKDCHGKEELWALTNRYQRIAAGTLDYDDVNFRILKGDVGRLIRGTRCQLFDVL
uniref:uncharacterized protein LOC117153503 n=1 Tax=Bombus vancouverensis nearcticus TaxID=2705178 RepID=UPI00143B5DD1|nr:uncharacterized protein LOC117153503 [Bombus vancouverensis nearcticus]